MDSAVFDSLRSALRASPGNRELALVVLRAALERDDPDLVRELLAELKLNRAELAEAERRELARAYLSLEEPASALEWLTGSDSETLILKAKAHCLTGELEDGRAAYRAAVAANPALEDRALSAELDSKVIRLDTARQGNLRKVTQDANDDTDDSEVVRLLHPETERVTFADVGGLDGVKKQIHRRIILPFQKPSLFQRFRRKAGGGILLYGPPGCGKTLLARATAGRVRREVLQRRDLRHPRHVHRRVGAQAARAVREGARSAPAVVFFDEVEALGGKRQYSREATSSKLVSQFLSEMDGFAQNNENVLMIGATNVPWAVDPAFRRPGRFDRVMFVPPPDRPARAVDTRSAAQGAAHSRRSPCREIAELTPGFSGADLRDLVESAVDEAIEASISGGREVPVTMQHLREALKTAKSTTAEWLTTARNYARYANEGGQYDEVLEFLDKHGTRR